MRCFGVCNTSPAVLGNLLLSKNILSTHREMAIVPVDTVLTDNTKPTRSVVFFVSITDFLRNLNTLNSKRYLETTVFLFASPLRLVELDNIVALDYREDPSAKGFGLQLLPTDKLLWSEYRRALKRPPLAVARNNREHLTNLTDSVKQGSLLTPLMTFIYSLPSSTLQTPVKLAVAKILVKGLPLSKLDAEVSAISEFTLSALAKTRLLKVLDSPIGAKYFKAFAEYRKLKLKKSTAATLVAIAKTHEVSDYELRYLCQVLESANKDKDVGKEAPKKGVLTMKARAK